ncbi:MAG: MotA/TolQ/ExbB proton channel family protein [Deltaproteobacteria bacterium]|jgi:biopolymer transport protein TolQ|nr:MotA/TolQ/ExbB proton channel family protein [Deltaproteobacteria bacterium]
MEIFLMLFNATPVVKGVLALLLVMSLISWSLIIYKFFSLGSALKKSALGLEVLSKAKDLATAVANLNLMLGSPVYHIAEQGINEFNRLKDNRNTAEVIYNNVSRSLAQGVGEVLAGLGGALSFLATCANAAPFIGLFGTVWGIMHSFHNIGEAGKASLATVAPGISEALIATAIGLFVAIPATIAYNAFVNRINRIETELVNFSRVFINRVQSEVDAIAQKR